MAKKCVYIFIILAMCLGAVSVSAQDYCVGADDVLEINVYREPELDTKTRISTEGYISLPLLGKVQVGGLTVMELEEFLSKKLGRYLKHPQVTVFISEYSKITVTGEVEDPGVFELKERLTVIGAINLAGGFSKLAARNNVKVIRMVDGKEVVEVVRVADISKRGDKAKDIPLKRGDIVFVPETLF